MSRVVTVTALEDYSLEVIFEDGVRGVICLKDRLFGLMFEPLLDKVQFGKVFVDEFGAVAWANGADLAPDALYERIRTLTPAK
ncbi:MAG: DUF2442 domain-containing protein [Planctomycetales bacterium]